MQAHRRDPCCALVVAGCDTLTAHGDEQVTPPLGVGGCDEGSTFPPAHQPQYFLARCRVLSGVVSLAYMCTPLALLSYQVRVGPDTHTYRSNLSYPPAGCRERHTRTRRPTPTLPSGSRMSAGGVRYPPQGSRMSAGGVRYPPQGSRMSAGGVSHTDTNRPRGCRTCILSHTHTRGCKMCFKSVRHPHGPAICVLGVLATLREGCLRSACHKHTKPWFVFWGCLSLTHWTAGCVSGRLVCL